MEVTTVTMKKAVYAGSFDPLTNGHLWMIEQGAKLFDLLVVAIGHNPDKRSLFTIDERVEIVRQSTQSLPDIDVASFENQYLVGYASSINARYILRGIRNAEDFEYERGWRHVNSDLAADIATVFLIPPRELAEVSSSLVQAMVGPIGWEQTVIQYVPIATFTHLVARAKRKESS
jgi:pantetheine-phosphate adenylyltransferase